MKFICDDNLGKLAKYLRILGFDTAFLEPVSDSKLMRLAATEERFLLTRDHHLLTRILHFGILVLEDNDPLCQLRTAIETIHLRIDPIQLFSRCSVCNVVCKQVEKANIGSHLFPYILNTQDAISQCPSCKRFYWKGSHYKRLLSELKNAVPPESLQAPWP